MIIPSGYAQVNLIFSGSDVPTGAQMTFGVNNQGSDLTAGAIAAEVIAQAVAASLEDCWTGGVDLSAVLVKRGPNATGASHLEPAAINGAATGQSVGPNTAFLIHKTTNAGGRAGRGRMYQPGCAESLVDSNGELNGTTASVLGAKWEAFRNGLELADLAPTLLHGEGSPLATPNPITALSMDSRVATQRRRNRR